MSDFWTAAGKLGLAVFLLAFALLVIGLLWVQVERWQSRHTSRNRHGK